MKCDHDDLRDCQCPECGLEVDAYGNTEAEFKNCCFPDCGCPEARLCMAPSGCNMGASVLLTRYSRLPKPPAMISAAEARGLAQGFRERFPDIAKLWDSTEQCNHTYRNTRDRLGRPFRRCSKCWRREDQQGSLI